MADALTVRASSVPGIQVGFAGLSPEQVLMKQRNEAEADLCAPRWVPAFQLPNIVRPSQSLNMLNAVKAHHLSQLRE